MKRFSVILFTLLLSMGMWAKSERRTVIFDVEIHCQNCINKIEKNIAFEPGVKDLVCNLDDKTVTVSVMANSGIMKRATLPALSQK